MTKTVKARSILSELLDESSEMAVSPISTISKPNERHAPPVYRKRPPVTVLSGSFQETLNNQDKHVRLDITYTSGKGFVGMDLFKAMGGEKFEIATTFAIEDASGSLTYNDYAVPHGVYHYYAVFFDGVATLSERTQVVTIQKSYDVSEEYSLISIVDVRIDHGQGIVLLSLKYNDPPSSNLLASTIWVLDDENRILGTTDNINMPVELPLDIHLKRLIFRVLDAEGSYITVGNSKDVFSYRIDFSFYQQDIGTVHFLPEVGNNRMQIAFNHQELNEDVDYFMILRRNLTIGEKSYDIPDVTWDNHTFFNTKKDVQTVFYDTNVFENDIYEYKILGYDLYGTLVGALIKKVGLKEALKEKE